MPEKLVRPAVIALSVLCLTVSVTALSTGSALAQAKGGQMAPQAAPPPAQQPQLKQIALTDKQIEGVIAASKDMDAIQEKMPQDGKQPDPKFIAQLEAAAKKYGFASFDDYNTVVDNIGLIMSGVDSNSKKYIGASAVAKMQIAEVQADKKMSPKDKKAALDELNAAAKEPDPVIENKGNIDLVLKNYDKLDALMGDDKN